MDIGLLILRLVLGLILFTHATQKLAGWFGGNGLSRQGEIFAGLGLRPGRAMVAAAATAELMAAVLLTLGLFTPVAALLAAATMLVAGVTMHLNSGSFWNVAGGGEYPYVLAACAAVLGFTGAGSLSADAALAGEVGDWFGMVATPQGWVGAGVVVIAIVAAIPFALRIRAAPRAE
ncbi:DoxX family protein [Nesterenkonia alba]|uniref:DoxX family protein n=1 Tax=Nesterenkonia alba TaxID=515814 RepID=UPI0003B4FA83|nr:DoxX family protein [Nesterenkonia alba]